MGDRHHGQRHLLVDVGHRVERRPTTHGGTVGVDGEQRPVEPPGGVRPERMPDGAGRVGGADDGHRPRDEHACHRSRVGALLATFHRVDELGGVLEVEVEVDHPGVEAALERPAGAREHGEHGAVLGQHLGGEPADAVGASDGREVLEQQRGDALALVLVVDHERGLGVVAVGPALVAGPPDELAVPLDHERHAVDEVELGEVFELAAAERGLGREVSAVLALARLPLVEGSQGVLVVGRDGAHRCGVAVAEDHRGGPLVESHRWHATSMPRRRRTCSGLACRAWIGRSGCSTRASAG
jgi:hypothetical protein